MATLDRSQHPATESAPGKRNTRLTWDKSRSLRQLVVFGITISALPAASPAQVRVLLSGGFSAAYQELLPQFQSNTGISVTTARGASQGDGPNTIGAQIRRGAAADVVIMSRNGLAELIAEGRIAAGSDVDLAQVPLGVGVRSGAPRPEINTVVAFKQSLLRAKLISSQSTTTIYLKTKLFPQLGIAGLMADKLLDAGPSDLPGGAMDMVVAPVSEILPVSGVVLVGKIPAEIQLVQSFAAALVKGGKEPEAARRLIAFLSSDKATPAIEKAGMNRPETHR